MNGRSYTSIGQRAAGLERGRKGGEREREGEEKETNRRYVTGEMEKERERINKGTNESEKRKGMNVRP